MNGTMGVMADWVNHRVTDSQLIDDESKNINKNQRSKKN